MTTRFVVQLSQILKWNIMLMNRLSHEWPDDSNDILSLICFPTEYSSIRKKKVFKKLCSEDSQNFIFGSEVISGQVISPQFCEVFGNFHSKISAFGLFHLLILTCHLAAYTMQIFHPHEPLELHGLFCWYLDRRRKDITTETFSFIARFSPQFFSLHFSTTCQGLYLSNDNGGRGVLHQSAQPHRTDWVSTS